MQNKLTHIFTQTFTQALPSAFIAATLGFMVLACQPRDVDPRYGTVEAGEVGSMVTDFRDIKSPSKSFDHDVEYIEDLTETGQQLSTCNSGSWSDIRMYDRSKQDVVYKSIYMGQRVAVLGSTFNCHKVGMRVMITSSSEVGRNFGHAVITRLMLVNRADLTPDMLAEMDHTEFSVNSMLRESQVASILVFKYVQGSAPREEHFLNSDVIVPTGVAPGNVGSLVDSLETIDSPSKEIVMPEAIEAKTKIGQNLSNCPAGGWNDIRVYDKFEKNEVYRSIYSGERVAILAFPKNCHTVGMRVLLSSQTEGQGSNYGEAIITGVYLIDRAELQGEFLNEVDHTETSIENYLKEETQASVITFKYVQGSAPNEAQYLGEDSPVATPAEGSATVAGGTPSDQVGQLVASFDSVFSPSKEVTMPTALEAQTQIGQNLSNCPAGGWSDIRVYDKFQKEEVYRSIYSGERVAILGFPKNCHTVGMQVLLTSQSEGRGSHYGEAVITGVYLVDRAELQGEFLTEIDHTEASIESYLKDETQASVITFKYIQGSATQEAFYLNASTNSGSVSTTDSASDAEEVEASSAGAEVQQGFLQNIAAIQQDVKVLEYVSSKKTLSTCQYGPWSEFRSYRQMDDAMIAGTRTMAITKGSLNCYQPTDVLSIYAPQGVPYAGKVLIKEVFLMKASQITDEMVAATAQSRADIESYIGSQTDVTVTVFEYLPHEASLPTETSNEDGQSLVTEVEGPIAFRPGQVLATCQNTWAPVFRLSNEEQAAFTGQAYKRAFALQNTPCMAVGETLLLASAQTGELILQNQVRLIRVERRTFSELNSEALNQLGFASLEALKAHLSKEWQRPLNDQDAVTLLFVRN